MYFRLSRAVNRGARKDFFRIDTRLREDISFRGRSKRRTVFTLACIWIRKDDYVRSLPMRHYLSESSPRTEV